jgi:probable phosphoglycerate mutase
MESNASHALSPDAGMLRLFELAQAEPVSLDCAQFFFLRHGQTPCNERRIFQGPDEPLSALGQSQAQQAAALLAAHPLASLHCSDMRRARETAAAVAGLQGVQPQPQAALRERNFGALIGTSSVGLDWGCVPERGETLETFVPRTRAGIVQALQGSEPTLLVAHGGTLLVLTAMLGVAMQSVLLGNAQPLRFARQGSAWVATPLG